MINFSRLVSSYVIVTEVTYNFSKSMCITVYEIIGPSVVAIRGVNTALRFLRKTPYIFSLYSLYLFKKLVLAWLSMLNLYLIVMCNPSIINPGPVNNFGSLSIYYQNVQGLIPFSSLSDKNPQI